MYNKVKKGRDISMKYANFKELTTERLVLRRLMPSDAENFYKFASDETVCKYMLWNTHKTISDTITSIDKSIKSYEKGGYYRFGIALKDSNILIGIIQLLAFDEIKSTCSFAYMIAKESWGMGYGTEALKAVINFAFSCMDIEIIEADHFSVNAASGAVMRKCGMTYIETVKSKYEKNGIIFDADRYVIQKN